MRPSNRKIAAYMLLPQILPRVKDLLGEGFGFVSFFMAQVFRSVGILPHWHPYLANGNIGRYGIFDVIGEGRRSIKWSRENIDQIIIFIAVILGLVLLAGQFFMIILSLFGSVAMAQVQMPTNFNGFFQTQNPEQDIAFIFMDRVFGLPDFFNSCASTGVPCLEGTLIDPVFPNNFHIALHNLFQFYSVGLLVVAAIIFLYFIVTVTVETAQTGTPFGKRFNHVWAPIRLVVALGLLIPVGFGFNGAQYIVFYAAKFGSSFATNGWSMFVNSLGENTLIPPEHLVPVLKDTGFDRLAEFMALVKTCEAAEEYQNGRDIRAWIVKADTATGSTPNQIRRQSAGANANPDIQYVVAANGQHGVIPYDILPFEEAVRFTGGRDIVIRFGEADNANGRSHEYGNEPGRVKPYCGEVVVKIPDVDFDGSPGARFIIENYYILLNQLWASPLYVDNARAYVFGYSPKTPSDIRVTDLPGVDIIDCFKLTLQAVVMGGTANCEYVINGNTITETNPYIGVFNEARIIQANSPSWEDDLIEYGWGGAGIWYNKIAQLNGSYVTAAYSIPEQTLLPGTMERVARQKAQNDAGTTGDSQFVPSLSGGNKVDNMHAKDNTIAQTLGQLDSNLKKAAKSDEPFQHIGDAVIKAIFGITGILDIRANASEQIHPLAQLSALGKGLLESTIGLVFGGVLAQIGAQLTAFDGPTTSAGLASISSGLLAIASIGITAGFLLFYVIPFLPFIYFFFGVGKWVKGIFEAMVGVPLWALAHIRIDGNGLPGDAAVSGYYLIFEIFIRPIMMIFGLIAAVSIFAAQVNILNLIWDLVTSNITGFDRCEIATALATNQNNPPECVLSAASTNLSPADAADVLDRIRGPVDQLFFTVLYIIVVYLMATASFKLIDLIPQNILRWMGSGAQAFGDGVDDPTNNLVQYTGVAGGFISSKVFGTIGSGGEGMRSSIAEKGKAARHKADLESQVAKKNAGGG